MRLDKYLSICADMSLRDALKCIALGQVKVNGRQTYANPLIKKRDAITLVDKPILFNAPKAIYLAYNKPRGIECTADRANPNNIFDAIAYSDAKLINIGRLDKDSEGLILMTNNGEIVNKIIHSDFEHEKEYWVKIDQALTNLFIIEQMEGGLDLWDYITKPCSIAFLDESNQYFKILLQEGKNRQIRRMFQKFGYEVTELKRVRVLNIMLNDLAIGAYRHLNSEELQRLSHLLKYKIPESIEIKY